MQKRLLLPLCLSGCLLTGCPHPLPYNPASNSDSTPPEITLRVSGDDASSRFDQQQNKMIYVAFAPIETHEQTPGTPVPSIQAHESGTVDVLFSAKDSGSGVRSATLSCQRQIYYNWDAVNQTEANTVLLPEREEKVFQVNNGTVPDFALLQRTLNMRGQFLFKNGAGTVTRGHRVTIRCSGEAKNFNGFNVFSHGIVIWAQDRSIQP